MAVLTNTRLPQTIGLEFAMPGIAVFHLMFLPLVTSHSVGARWPSPLPLPAAPRNEGQFLGAMGAVGATGAGVEEAISGTTRASKIVAGPCTSCIDSIGPARSVNVSVALTSGTRSTPAADGVSRNDGCPATWAVSAPSCAVTLIVMPPAPARYVPA